MSKDRLPTKSSVLPASSSSTVAFAASSRFAFFSESGLLLLLFLGEALRPLALPPDLSETTLSFESARYLFVRALSSESEPAPSSSTTFLTCSKASFALSLAANFSAFLSV